jgi:hypothetical protein
VVSTDTGQARSNRGCNTDPKESMKLGLFGRPFRLSAWMQLLGRPVFDRTFPVTLLLDTGFCSLLFG